MSDPFGKPTREEWSPAGKLSSCQAVKLRSCQAEKLERGRFGLRINDILLSFFDSDPTQIDPFEWLRDRVGCQREAGVGIEGGLDRNRCLDDQ
jgi:hypothetical protein